MDGTLVDSQASIEAVWFEFADRHGIDRAVVAQALPGRIASDIIVQVLGKRANVESELNWIRQSEQQNSHPVRAIAGAEKFLASVPPERWAIVTSAPRSMMERRLTAAGLPIPRVSVCAEDVHVGKPDPEGFLAAATRLKVPADSCTVFEDSSAGMAAAANAGATCVAIGTEPGRNLLRVNNFTSLRLSRQRSELVIDVVPEL
ncbi:HAD-IA family hydrolase [Rhodococcus erythropolis]|nr:HAD-IA family hydrolase [Rhodococcus erythropolis]MDV6272992.1 HAD-IA family hydrolase [Rhodococcus erythropolis]